MATKGPKSAPSKGIAKSIASAAGIESDVPPVPFVASPTAIAKPVANKPAPKPAVAPKASPDVRDLAKVVAPVGVPSPSPEPVAQAEPATPSPVVVAGPVAPEPVSPPTPAIAPATAVLQKEMSTMDATINTAADTAQTQAKTMFADVNDRAKTAMEKGSKMIADMNEFSKGNLEAVVESSKIAAKGAEDIARYTSDYVRSTVEKASTTASQFASIKSPTEFFKLHSEMTKQAMDSMMAETAKFTEGYVKLLGEIAQPISNRVAVAVEKVKVAA
ncbi:phasin family protein [Sphingomonas sp. TREG-RG-20F-R18-01]|uniref:phasin family protein n=1 Tax=Sphingomonas sp. TREG-RG-20F-R18-01 TaxID=2914982 RepID=UPI001F57702B|nr:phasin family protein [Sphingomonas sp. TREG-RG-20F-R18-01]